MKSKKIILLLFSLLLVLSACGEKAPTSEGDGGTNKETPVTEGDTQAHNDSIFDHVMSNGRSAGSSYSVDRDGMIYRLHGSDGKYSLKKELTKKEDPAVMADVSNTQVVFMLSDGTIKYQGIVMPPIDANDEKSDFAESYTLAKFEKDKVKAIKSGDFGVFVVLDTDGKLFGTQLTGGTYEVFAQKDEWISLNRFKHTEAQELKLIADDVKDVRLAANELLVLKNNGDLIRYDMDAIDGVKVASNIKEVGKILLFDSIGLKEDSSLQLFMTNNADYRVEASFDSIKYDDCNPILTKGDDEYTIFLNNSKPHFENTDFFSDTKVITLHYEDGKVREEGYLQKINYDKFSELGVGKIRYLDSDYIFESDSKSGERENYLQIIDEDNKGFIISDKGEVVRKIDVIDKENIYEIMDINTLK